MVQRQVLKLTVKTDSGQSKRRGTGGDRQRVPQKAVRLCERFENGIMMTVGHLDRLPSKAVRAPGRPEFA